MIWISQLRSDGLSLALQEMALLDMLKQFKIALRELQSVFTAVHLYAYV